MAGRSLGEALLPVSSDANVCIEQSVIPAKAGTQVTVQQEITCAFLIKIAGVFVEVFTPAPVPSLRRDLGPALRRGDGVKMEQECATRIAC